MKFVYFNDTNRIVSIHPATLTHGCEVELDAIKPLEERVFTLPEGTYAWVKMWDYGERGLQILVSPRSLANDSIVKHEPIEEHDLVRKAMIQQSISELFNKEKKHIEVEPKETSFLVFKKKVDYSKDPFKEE